MVRRHPLLVLEACWLKDTERPGVIAKLLECRTDCCRIDAADHAGWVQRGDLWGVYPDETVQ